MNFRQGALLAGAISLFSAPTLAQSGQPDSVVYVLSTASRFEVKTGKAGLLGFAGHAHVVRARGAAWLGNNRRSRAVLALRPAPVEYRARVRVGRGPAVPGHGLGNQDLLAGSDPRVNALVLRGRGERRRPPPGPCARASQRRDRFYG